MRPAFATLLVLGIALPSASVSAQQTTPRSAALEVRLQELEESLRRLTGRVEELEHQQRLMEGRLAEGGRPASPQTSPAPAMPAPVAEAPAPAPTVLAAPEPPAPRVAAAPTPAAPDPAPRQSQVLGTIPQSAAPGPATSPDADSYRSGLDLLQSARWAEAEQAFAAFVQEHPDDPRTPTASYWLGETYLLRKDYQTAAAVFARNYRTYGDTAPRAADNLLKLGVALNAMGERDKACQTFAELAKRHPNASPPIRQALSRERAAAGCT